MTWVLNRRNRTGHWATVLPLIALIALAEAAFAQNISEVGRSVPESQIIESKRALELLGTSDVLKVQTFLKDQGFDVPLDGKLGGHTREAFDSCMNNGSMCGFFLLEKIVEEYAGDAPTEQEPEGKETAEDDSGRQTGRRCKIEGDGIIPIVRSIKSCMQQPVLKDVTESSSDNCETGSNSPACRTKAACDKNQKSRDCLCGQNKNSDECRLATACSVDRYSSQCLCGSNPLGQECATAIACEPSSDVRAAWDEGETFTTGTASTKTSQSGRKPVGTSSSTFEGDNEGGINSRLTKQIEGGGKPFTGGPLIVRETLRTNDEVKIGAGGQGTTTSTQNVERQTQTRRPGSATAIEATGRTTTTTGYGATKMEAMIAAISRGAGVFNTEIKSTLTNKSTNCTQHVKRQRKSATLTPIAGYTVGEIRKTRDGFEATVDVQEGKVRRN